MLNELIDSWLTAPPHRLGLRFPAPLEEQFESDTGADRARGLGLFGLVGFALGTALFPVIVADMSDVAGAAHRLYLGFSMPLGFLLSASILFKPPPVLREGLTLVANLVCIAVTAYLFALSRQINLPFAVGGVAVLMVYSAIGIQLRFGYALTAVTAIVAGYGLALHAHAGLPPATQRNLVMMAAATGAYLMLANWRLERALRRGYLVMLRERLQRQDLSKRNIELDELARRDPLTGLANRRAYDAWLAAVWGQQTPAERQKAERLGLIVLDIDRFKAFNDFYGHSAGDTCLKKIAVCLREQLRGTTDLVARLGGEEFAVLLPDLSEALCADIAERMRLAVQQLELPHSGLGPRAFVSISAGVASCKVISGGSAHLFKAADSALYQAKMSGRNRVCVALASQIASIPEGVAD